jgi:hypothetical protein
LLSTVGDTSSRVDDIAGMTRLLVLGSIALSVRPAEACTGCKPPTEAELVDAAKRVFGGKVVAVGAKTITLEVDAVWKGAATKTEVFETTCWWARKPGAKLIVLDRAGKPSKWFSQCLEVSRDSATTRARIDKLAGTPREP